MAFWLVKSEPTAYSIDDLQRDGESDWSGVRNYKARNSLKAMQVGDRLIFYHSNADPPGAAGVAEVCAPAHPDATQFDRNDDHHDPKATPDKPIWYCPDVRFVAKFRDFVPLATLRDDDKLTGMLLTSGKASRLSVQPLSKPHFDRIVALGAGKA